MIATCTCKHKYQDKKHGANRRVFNVKNARGIGDVQAKCTVCEAKKSVHLK